MSNNYSKSDVQVGFRLPSEMVNALMKYQVEFAGKTDVYLAAIAFYLEAAKQFGVDHKMRPKWKLVRLKDVK